MSLAAAATKVAAQLGEREGGQSPKVADSFEFEFVRDLADPSKYREVKLVRTRHGEHLVCKTFRRSSLSKLSRSFPAKPGMTSKRSGEAIGAKESSIDKVKREIAIMKRLSHDNCAKLLQVFSGGETIHLFIEYLSGGVLMKYQPETATFQTCPVLNALHRDRYTEGEARVICAQIACGLVYLHRINIVHRDLKPDNVLVSSRGVIKVSKQARAGQDRASASHSIHTCRFRLPISASPTTLRKRARRCSARERWRFCLPSSLATSALPTNGILARKTSGLSVSSSFAVSSEGCHGTALAST